MVIAYTAQSTIWRVGYARLLKAYGDVRAMVDKKEVVS